MKTFQPIENEKANMNHYLRLQWGLKMEKLSRLIRNLIEALSTIISIRGNSASASLDTTEKFSYTREANMPRGKDEAELIRKFKREIMTIFPKAFFYKIPDFPGGPLRPYDVEFKVLGLNFALEFKSEGGVLSAHQKYFLDLAESNGAFSMVVRPDNWNACIKDIVTLVKKKEEEGFNAN